MSGRRLNEFWLTWLLVCLSLAVSVADEPVDPPAEGPERTTFERILIEKQIEPTAEGLNDYFRSLHPTPEQRRRVEELIEQLGTEQSFALREEATRQLLLFPVLPAQPLKEAANGSDPEVAWRARRILEIGKPESSRVLYAALRTVADRQLSDGVPEVLRAVPLADRPHLRHAAQIALRKAATADHAQLLRSAIAEADRPSIRIAAILALEAALKEQSGPDLRPLLESEEERVRLTAARSLANHGDRAALPVLVDLLSAAEIANRVSASAALRDLTGEHFGYAAYNDATKRQASIERWRAWLEEEATTAELDYPLKSELGGPGYLNGNTLLAFGYRNKVAEYDPSGNEVWSFPGQGAWSAEKMANGNVLIAAYNENRVIEVDPSGDIVWEYSCNNPLNAKPLLSGNVLIAVYSDRKAIEVTPDKEVVWSYDSNSNTSDIHRLPNGNTLVAAYGQKVVEVTPDGEVVWEHANSQCYGCQPLDNGNLLIADFSGKAKEIDRDGNTVWEFAESGVVDVFRLPSGNTLLTSGRRFLEVTPDNKIVWEKQGCNYGTARR